MENTENTQPQKRTSKKIRIFPIVISTVVVFILTKIIATRQGEIAGRAKAGQLAQYADSMNRAAAAKPASKFLYSNLDFDSVANYLEEDSYLKIKFSTYNPDDSTFALFSFSPDIRTDDKEIHKKYAKHLYQKFEWDRYINCAVFAVYPVDEKSKNDNIEKIISKPTLFYAREGSLIHKLNNPGKK